MGSIPLAGFIIGCICLGIASIILFLKFAEWVGTVSGFLGWFDNQMAVSSYRYAEKMKNPEYYARKRRNKQIRKKIGNAIAFVTMGVIGAWMLWGFIEAALCSLKGLQWQPILN
jgi:hypothetical protein